MFLLTLFKLIKKTYICLIKYILHLFIVKHLDTIINKKVCFYILLKIKQLLKNYKEVKYADKLVT